MSPEELETALEDALVLRDVDGVAGLFEPAGVLDAGPGLRAGDAPRSGGSSARCPPSTGSSPVPASSCS
ncbi:hypothetical protein, partial [Pseudonocardia aurantiaca]|uniref:hypothetical protein n=1 Tax=Pseudonocardia aurantiaca TaxID=75290 RepID=UPI0031CE6E7E